MGPATIPSRHLNNPTISLKWWWQNEVPRSDLIWSWARFSLTKPNDANILFKQTYKTIPTYVTWAKTKAPTTWKAIPTSLIPIPKRRPQLSWGIIRIYVSVVEARWCQHKGQQSLSTFDARINSKIGNQRKLTASPIHQTPDKQTETPHRPPGPINNMHIIPIRDSFYTLLIHLSRYPNQCLPL